MLFDVLNVDDEEDDVDEAGDGSTGAVAGDPCWWLEVE